MKFNLIYIISLVLGSVGVIFYYLLKNSLICSTYDFEGNIVPSLCRRLSLEGDSAAISTVLIDDVDFGNFCSYLCSTQLEFTCHTYHLNKPYVFTLNEVLNEEKKCVIKAIIEDGDEEVYWKNHDTYVPSPEEMQNMVLSHIDVFLGVKADPTLKPIQSILLESKMENLVLHEQFWNLIYDHEFLMTHLFTYHRLFPKVLGTCQNYYAVEYAQPLIENPFLPLNIPWKVRLQKAVDLVGLIEKVQTAWIEPIHLCDIKHDHFGWKGKDVLFLDLDCVVTDSSLRSINLNTPQCSCHEDCSYFDCLGECLPTKRCSGRRRNTNLQVLCNKIFLGNSDSSFLPLYGLLNGSNFSQVLKDALEVCATNPGMTVEGLLEILHNESTLV